MNDSGIVTINGTPYKIGVHGLVFMMICGKWQRSSKTPAEFKAEMLRKSRIERM